MKSIINEEPQKWDIIKSEYFIRRPWLTARKDHVRLPDGRENPEHWVLEYPDWVNVIAITDDGQFVFERQYRHALGTINYEICAGVIEEGEEPLDAAKRELMEETGFGGGTWTKLMEIGQNPSCCNNLTHCYLAEGVTRLGDQDLDSTEDISVYLLSREEVWELMQTDQLKQALMVAPLWKYFASYK